MGKHFLKGGSVELSQFDVTNYEATIDGRCCSAIKRLFRYPKLGNHEIKWEAFSHNLDCISCAYNFTSPSLSLL